MDKNDAKDDERSLEECSVRIEVSKTKDSLESKCKKVVSPRRRLIKIFVLSFLYVAFFTYAIVGTAKLLGELNLLTAGDRRAGAYMSDLRETIDVPLVFEDGRSDESLDANVPVGRDGESAIFEEHGVDVDAALDAPVVLVDYENEESSDSDLSVVPDGESAAIGNSEDNSL